MSAPRRRAVLAAALVGLGLSLMALVAERAPRTHAYSLPAIRRLRSDVDQLASQSARLARAERSLRRGSSEARTAAAPVAKMDLDDVSARVGALEAWLEAQESAEVSDESGEPGARAKAAARLLMAARQVLWDEESDSAARIDALGVLDVLARIVHQPGI